MPIYVFTYISCLIRMKNIIINIIGAIIDIFCRIYYRYKVNKVCSLLYSFGGDSHIAYPFIIRGEKNIVIADCVSIGAYSTLTAINARIIIKKKTVIAPYIYISTGDHRMIPGRFCISITNEEKGVGYDSDVIINEDVWIASRVTILKGVTVGRGAILAAGAVVNKDVLPYSVVGGVPAKFIKFKWRLEQILEHEEKLYSIEERFSETELKSFGIQ